MFTILQKRMKLIFIVLLVLIAPGFLLYGIFSYAKGGAKEKVIGEVFGEKVTAIDYAQNHRAVMTLLFLRFPQQFEMLSKYYDIEQLVWNRILISRAANKMNIKAGEKEVMEYIRAFRVFQDAKGTFDINRYKEIIGNRLSIPFHVFERVMEQNFINEKLLRTIERSTMVFEADIKDFFIENNEQVKLQYLSFSDKDYRDKVKISDEALLEYLNENKKLFEVPDKVQIQYVLFSYADHAEGLQISDEEVTKYYNDHKQMFVLPPEEKEEGEKEKDDEQVKYKAYEEVKEDITNVIRKAKSEKAAMDACRALFYEIEEQRLQEIAQQKKMEIKTSKYFAKNEFLPEIGISSGGAMGNDFYSEVFQIDTGEITSPIRTSKGVILAEKIDLKEVHLPENLEEVYEPVKDAYLKRESSSLARESADQLAVKLKELDELGIQSVLKEMNMEFQETDFFKKIDSYVKGIGVSREFMNQVFSQEDNIFSPAVGIPGGVVLFRIIDRKEADFSLLEENRADLEQKLKNMKSSRVVQDWIKNMEKASKLKKIDLEPEQEI